MVKDFQIVVTIETWGKDEDEALSNIDHILQVVRDNVAGECYDITVNEVGTIMD